MKAIYRYFNKIKRGQAETHPIPVASASNSRRIVAALYIHPGEVPFCASSQDPPPCWSWWHPGRIANLI
jgi:hypothetical protein